jgi:intracellular sulfur oxidation DsrE/DsrF family protein
MKVLHLAILLFSVGWLGSALGAEAAAEYPGDRMTLGDARALKGVFSVNAADSTSVAGNLAGIRDMGVSLRKQGVTPEFAVVFMGPSVRQLRRGDIAPDVAEVLAQLRNQKVELNVCSVAMGAEGVAAADLVEGVRVIGDGLIAVLAYQQRGYGYAPPF